MKQVIQINTEIPENYTLVETEWLNNLMKQTLPAFWTMEDLIKESKLSRYKIEKRILEVPRFNKYLKENDIWFEGQGGSSSHYFDAELMWKFLKDYKKEIYKGVKK